MNPRLRLAGIVVNQVESTRESRFGQAELAETFGELVWSPKGAAIAVAYGANTPLRRYGPVEGRQSPRSTTSSPPDCSRSDLMPAQPVRAARPHPASAAARTAAAARRRGPGGGGGGAGAVQLRASARGARALKRHAAESDQRIQDIVANALRAYLRDQ